MRGAVKVGRNQPGFILATMAVVTSVLMVCVGLAIDTGYLQLIRTRMQAAADAAAVGGAQEFHANGSGNVVAAAKGDAALNGFTDGANAVSITVNSPPQSGYYTADSTAVEVIVSQKVSPIFMGIIGFGKMGVSARSVAHQANGGAGCMYVMDPSAAGAFTIVGGVQLTVHCGIMINSNSSTAMLANGGTNVTANSIGIVGSYSVSGGSSVNPTPVTHISSFTDPFANLTPPATGSCNYTNTTVGNGATRALTPGVYCNGITLNGGAHVTLSAGNYILMGGGLNVSNGVTLSGTGVTFYNTAGSGYSYGPITLTGGTTETLTAPTTGSLAGILFFQDRSIVGGAASSFSGGATAYLNGTLYFPTTTLSYSGGSGTSYTIIVSKQISFSNGAMLNSDYSSLPGGSPIKGSVSLGE